MIERRTPQFSPEDLFDLLPFAGYTAIAVMVSLLLFSWLDSVISHAYERGYPFATAAHYFKLAGENVQAGVVALAFPPHVHNGALQQSLFGTPTPRPTPGVMP